MPKSTRSGRPASRKGKVRKEFWLSPKLLKEAQARLGTATERETVEMALDMVAFRQEVAKGIEALAGMKFNRID